MASANNSITSMTRGLHCIFQCENTEWTSGYQYLRTDFHSVIYPNFTKSLSGLRRGFHPHPPPTSFTAQTPLSRAVQLFKGDARNGTEQDSGLIKDIVLLAE